MSFPDYLDDTESNAYAHEIGWVCIHWRWLEFLIESALLHLLTLPQNDDAGHCVMVESDIRAKSRMLKSIGFIKRPSDEWYERLERLINSIDNDLRPKRNDIVHGLWTHDGRQPLLTRGVSKVIRPQSHQRSFKRAEYAYPSETGMRAFNDTLLATLDQLQELMHEIPGWADAIA